MIYSLALLPVLTAPPQARVVAMQPHSGSVDRAVEVGQNGTLWIVTMCGRLALVGGETTAVRVTGEIGEDAELQLTNQGATTRLEVKPRPKHSGGLDACADLSVHMPATMRTKVQAVSADVTISALSEEVSIGTVSGDIRLGPSIRTADLESVSGGIYAQGVTGELDAASVSGDVTITGGAGRVEAESVSGEISVQGTMDRLEMASVSGDIEMRGTMTPSGRLEAASHSGDVLVVLPPDMGGSFDLSTFSGLIVAKETEGRPRHHGPGHEVQFIRGDGGVVVALESFSGRITVQSPSTVRSTTPR